MNIPNVTYSSIKLIYTSDVEHTVDMSLSSTYRASFAGNARIEITYKSNISLSKFLVRVTPDELYTIDEYDIDKGKLAYWDSNVTGNKEHTFQFPINPDYFVKGAATYRISLYAQSSIDYSWDVTYLFITSNNLLFVPKNSDALEVLKCDYNLPEEYQEIEYIETTGTQGIDTTLLSSDVDRVEHIIEFTRNDVRQLMGTGNDDSCWGVYTDGRYERNTIKIDKLAGNKDLVVMDNSWTHAQINHENITAWQGSLNWTNNSYRLFYVHQSDATDNFYCHCKFYSFKAFKDGEVVSELVPCYRKSDNVIGLYDKIRKIFLINDHAGTFLKGKDIY